MLDLLNDLIWSKLLIVMLIGLGLLFTIRSGFVQFRYFGNMFTIFGHAFERQPGQLSSFQALMLSVAGRVGAGNIAGVSVAIMLGGPGAIFWMWVVALVGMAMAFAESTLAQLYKTVNEDGQYRGGPAFYISKGLGLPWLGAIFCVFLIFAFGLVFNAVQANSIAEAFEGAYGLPRVGVGLVLAALAGIVIFGGIRQIARVAELTVPFMAAAYVLLALFIVVKHFNLLAGALGEHAE